MKKRIALLTIMAASAVAVASFKKYQEKQKDQPKALDLEQAHVKDLSDRLPKHPEQSVLSSTLLESYRVQCHVMMDAYPEGKHLDVLHHLEAQDSTSYEKLRSVLTRLNLRFEERPDQNAFIVKETIETKAQAAYDAVVEIASLAYRENAHYQGWIFENCY